jgi:hypothetical protein
MNESRNDGPEQGDPLIDEIRAIRKQISEEHGNDIRRLGEYLKKVQEQYADRLVRNPKEKASAQPER